MPISLVRRATAGLLNFEPVASARLDQLFADEFGETPIPDHAWRNAVTSVIARLASEHHLVIACPAAP